MIRHIVFFSAKRPEDIPAIKTGLALLEQIPHSTVFEIRDNSRIDLFENEIDVVVYAEFADEAALAAYKAHEFYDRATSIVRPMRDLRFSADIAA